MIRVFTNTNYLSEENRRRVFPLLFDMWYLKNTNILKHFEFVSEIENGDLCILPLDYSALILEEESFVSNFISNAKRYNKKIWVYTAGDYGFSIKDTSIFNFRLGGFNSKLSENTVVMPCFISDPYTEVLNVKFRALDKTEKPNIGFVGNAGSGIIKYGKEFISYLKQELNSLVNNKKEDYQPFYPSSIKRNKLLKLLENDNLLLTDFIKRKKYRAGINNYSDKKSTTFEFYKNIFENTYTFCLRGTGNFSVRFYETLAVGRIPILIDTDCRLPFENLINWEKHCVIIKPEQNLAKTILNFHNQLSKAEFMALQYANRELWLNTLERVSFFKTLAKSIKN